MASESSVEVATIPKDNVVWIPVGYELPLVVPAATSYFGFQISPVVLPHQEVPYPWPGACASFIDVNPVSQIYNRVHGHQNMASGLPARHTATKELKIPRSCDRVGTERPFFQLENGNYKSPNCITSGVNKKRKKEDTRGLLRDNKLWTKTESVKRKVKRFLNSAERAHSKGSLCGSASLDKIVSHIETEFSTVLDSKYDDNSLLDVPRMNWNLDLKLITESEVVPYWTCHVTSEMYSSGNISNVETDSLICCKDNDGHCEDEITARNVDKTTAEQNLGDNSRTGTVFELRSQNEDPFVTNAEENGYLTVSRTSSICNMKNTKEVVVDENDPSSFRSYTEMTDLSEISSTMDLASQSNSSFHSWSNCSLATQSSIYSVSLDCFIQTSSGLNTHSQSMVLKDNIICKPEVVSPVKDHSSSNPDCSRKCLTESCLMDMSSRKTTTISEDISHRNGMCEAKNDSSNSERKATNTHQVGNNLLLTSQGVMAMPTDSVDENNVIAKNRFPNSSNYSRTINIDAAIEQCPPAPKKRKYPINRGDRPLSIGMDSSSHSMDSNTEFLAKARARRRLFEDDDRMSKGDGDVFLLCQ